MITLLHLITGLETGGAERMLLQVARRIDRARFRQQVVSSAGSGPIGALIDAGGVPVRTLGLRRGVPDPRGITRLARILRELRPDVLQTWMYHADLLGTLTQPFAPVPHLVWGLHATDAPGAAGLRRILAWCSARPDAIVTVSRAGQHFHESIGYHPRRWEHIPNGFDAQALRPAPDARRRIRLALGIGDNMTAILLPARYHPMKDHATFLAAAAILARTHREPLFVLAGSGTGPDNRDLVAAIAVHGLAGRIMLLGERRDLDALYAAFDVVTLSSSVGEAMPMVLGEAMACGIPCVATDTGDCAAIIGDTGIVVPPRDPAALAAAWQRIVALGRDERRALGLRARARIEYDYDLARIVARYERLYEEIAAKPSRGAGLDSWSGGVTT